MVQKKKIKSYVVPKLRTRDYLSNASCGAGSSASGTSLPPDGTCSDGTSNSAPLPQPECSSGAAASRMAILCEAGASAVTGFCVNGQTANGDGSACDAGTGVTNTCTSGGGA